MVMRAGVALLMLVGKHTHEALAQNLIQTMPRIVSFLDAHEPPLIARIHRAGEEAFRTGRPGTVKLWLNHQMWLKSLH